MVGEGKKQTTGFSTRDDMAKSLGQIHTINTGQSAVSTGQSYLVDLPGELSNQLQTMVRQGQYFKVVGIDAIAYDLSGGQTSAAVINGELRYYAPTRGRCEAYKQAYRAVRKGMELQGINMRGNRNYDFRVPAKDLSNYVNGPAFLNTATIDGTNALALVSGTANDSVFDVYNSNIQPSQTAAVTFSDGYGLPGAPGTATDFVLNEGEIFDPSLTRSASLQLETIPFTMAYNPVNNAYEFMWRPDPALYLAVMCGFFEIHLDQVDGGSTVDFSFAFHVSGWKSIMGNPDTKRRSSKKKSMTRGRKK